MGSEAVQYLAQQFATAWKLADFHLHDLSTEECLWRPSARGPHVHQAAGGIWIADWPEHEGYDIGAPSIGWVTWHMGFWWSMVLDHSLGSGRLTREQVHWPGDADRVRTWLGELRQRWQEVLDSATDATLRSAQRTRWPFQDRPYGDIVAWVNIELTKNAAEIGYVRFLYAQQGGAGSIPDYEGKGGRAI